MYSLITTDVEKFLLGGTHEIQTQYKTKYALFDIVRPKSNPNKVGTITNIAFGNAGLYYFVEFPDGTVQNLQEAHMEFADASRNFSLKGSISGNDVIVSLWQEVGDEPRLLWSETAHIRTSSVEGVVQACGRNNILFVQKNPRCC